MSVFGKDEAAMRKYAASMPLPEFDETSFVQPKSLSNAKVAIVTTAALHRESVPDRRPGNRHRRALVAGAGLADNVLDGFADGIHWFLAKTAFFLFLCLSLYCFEPRCCFIGRISSKLDKRRDAKIYDA